MTKGIFITGTDTNVGKTVVSGGLMYLLRSNSLNACYFKPILSGAMEKGSKLIPGDTEFVKNISKLNEKIDVMTPFIFKTPVSPHLAAKIENKSINVDVILKNFLYLKNKYDFIIAEGCGGIAVPLNERNYMLHDLIKRLGMDVLVVCDTGLGTINHTILTVRYAQSVGINVKGLILNGFNSEYSQIDNINTIKGIVDLPILGVIPEIKDVDTENLRFGNLKNEFEKHVDVEELLKIMSQI